MTVLFIFLVFCVVLSFLLLVFIRCLVYSMLYVTLVFSNVYLLSLSCVLCIQCCMCLWIVHYRFPLRLSLTFTCCLCPVSCVCCMCLWIVYYRFPLRLSLTLLIFFVLCLVYVVCVSGLSIIGFLFGCL